MMLTLFSFFYQSVLNTILHSWLLGPPHPGCNMHSGRNNIFKGNEFGYFYDCVISIFLMFHYMYEVISIKQSFI